MIKIFLFVGDKCSTKKKKQKNRYLCEQKNLIDGHKTYETMQTSWLDKFLKRCLSNYFLLAPPCVIMACRDSNDQPLLVAAVGESATL